MQVIRHECRSEIKKKKKKKIIIIIINGDETGMYESISVWLRISG